MIFTGILLLLDVYLSATLIRPFFMVDPLFFSVSFTILQLIFLSQVWLYFVFFKSTADQKIAFERPLQRFAFYGIGALSFLFCFAIFRDVLALSLLPVGKAALLYGEIPSRVIFILSAICVFIGALNARYKIVSPKVPISIQNLPKGLQGLKIVQLSDVHLGTGPGPEQVARLVDRALSLKPDLIVLTGDIIDGNIPDIQKELVVLSRLNAPQGVYFILGNHECYWKHEDAIAEMKKNGFIVLQNQGVEKTVNGELIFIAGLNDPAIVQFKGEGPKVPAVPPNSKFNLMLVHQPRFSKLVEEHPYHLQLSGHTHGGQFFPWNLAVRKVHEFHQGLERTKNLWVYVNMGSGYWGPPLRLGTQCEVTELVLEGKSE